MSSFNKILIIILFLVMACSKRGDESSVNYLPVSDLSKYNLKVLPAVPVSGSKIVIVVYDDCQYNLLAGVTRNGTTIEIEKHFNSMMKLPCMLRNDTIQIGFLPAGSYTVNYKLLDLSTQAKDAVSLAISFELMVSK